MTKQGTTNLNPPDGGWGWIIVFAYALSNIVVIPIIQNVGLIFGSRFQQLNFTGTDISIIINTNSAFGMLMGLVNGTLIKKFGYRKISIIGGLFVSIGVILTAFANTFEYFFITYGLLTSLGFGMTIASFSFALNSYFKDKRGIAVGFAMTGTGLGPIFMPLLISYLLDQYGVEGTMLIIGALSMNVFVAAALLQPVQWHMKSIISNNEQCELQLIDNFDKTKTVTYKNCDEPTFSETFNSKLALDHDVETQSIYGFETPLPRRKMSGSSICDTRNLNRYNCGDSILQPDSKEGSKRISESSFKSHISVKLANCKEENIKPLMNDIEIEKSTIVGGKKSLKSESQSYKSHMLKLLYFLDYDLLKDPVYVNLMLGMSLAICAEMNFSLLTPFILIDMGLNIHEIAQVLSSIAFSDIVFRFLAPFMASWLKQTPKVMYVCSLLMLVLSRTALIFTRNFWDLIMLAVILGIAKGFRTVFMSLLIPSYVPLHKLANASGIQMVANGIVIMLGGPLLGIIRDLTGSYNQCIIIINLITLTTIALWSIEGLYLKCIKK